MENLYQGIYEAYWNLHDLQGATLCETIHSISASTFGSLLKYGYIN